jgi:predicted DCC family thiol-disulfide oxidoreductase YuxK
MAASRVANPPERPLAIFDGDCGFCRQWIARWTARTGPRVDFAPSQEVAHRFPEVPKEAFARAFQLVLPDGRVLEGAAAVLGTLERAPGNGELSAVYARVPGFAACSELAYRAVAGHRPAAAALTRFFWGRSVEKPTYFGASAVFLRALGLCYLAAFVSLWVQVDGLVGARGILPVGQFLDWVRAQTGSERYWLLPTLCWLSSSDAFLHLLCGGGAFAALLLVVGLAPAASAAAAWLLYLSLTIAGQVFLEFQWDHLLLETGFLAIFLVSPRRGRFRSGLAASPVALFLLRWLLFRLMFSSGWVKLASGDPAWRNLSALRFYYETQPLPPWTAWFTHQCPPWFQTVSALFLFFVELVMPFLFFAPRRLRLFAFRATVLLQLLIAATGNYGFFNLLALALALLLVGDQSLPQQWRRAAEATAGPPRPWPSLVLVPLTCVAIFASSVEFAATLDRALALPRPVVAAERRLGAFRSFNRYGLFMVMTTERPEIVIEGSDDGAAWRPYAFYWKPGDVAGRPRFVAPHQPRLDWQMWFAALGSPEENPWLVQFLGRLLEGAPQVEGLLAANPFPDHPPRYVRATLYDYRFTDTAERRRTGAWWRRRPLGLYGPVLERGS